MSPILNRKVLKRGYPLMSPFPNTPNTSTPTRMVSNSKHTLPIPRFLTSSPLQTIYNIPDTATQSTHASDQQLNPKKKAKKLQVINSEHSSVLKNSNVLSASSLSMKPVSTELNLDTDLENTLIQEAALQERRLLHQDSTDQGSIL